MDHTTRERIVDGNIWLRGLHMLIFLIAYNIAEIIIVMVAVFQFLSVLITGSVNEPLLRFGKNLSVYAEEIFEFLTFNSEIRPFPFEAWPDENSSGETWRERDEPTTETEVSETSADNVSADNESADNVSADNVSADNVSADDENAGHEDPNESKA